MYLPMFFDPTYILVAVGAILCLLAQQKVSSTYSKYSRVASLSGMTGAQTAQRILHANGLYDVSVQHVAGNLTDHYDPKNKVVNLSDATYGSTSVAAVGVAAHECGHAIQHATAYAPLNFRSALVPVANFGSAISWPMIIIGFFITNSTGNLLISIGILAFSLAVLFQLVTLPVEFNASARAMKQLEATSILSPQELSLTRKVLSAAALTYVASAAAMILQLLRLLLLANRRSD